MAAVASKADSASGALTWALSVSTYNRIDMLEQCVRHALRSTRMPAEIVICDASTDWEGNRARIAPQAEAARVPLIYLRAPKRSLPAQRNCGIAAATADILFLIDDDAFLYPDCAETIMRIYEADRLGRIVAVSATDAPMPGSVGPVGAGKGGLTKAPLIQRILARSSFARLVWLELLLMSADRVFIPYDRKWHKADDSTVAAYSSDRVIPLTTMSGYRMTVRRSVALAEPFDDELLAYASAEDLDATYRFSRHGWNVQALDARLHHHEAMAARLRREQSTQLGVLNVAFLLRKHTSSPVRSMIQFYVMLMRRLLAEFLKDLLARRWQFPQFLGVAKALVTSVSVMAHDRATLGQFYDGIQRRILGLPLAGAS